VDLASHIIEATEALMSGSVSDDIITKMHAKQPVPKVETWEIGKQISHEDYQRFKDPTTSGVYLVYVNMYGKKQIRFATRESWEIMVKVMQAMP